MRREKLRVVSDELRVIPVKRVTAVFLDSPTFEGRLTRDWIGRAVSFSLLASRLWAVDY